jgi:hypothetical protein
MTAASIAIATTGATLFVTVLLFAAEWIRRRVVAHRENRERIINRTLDTLEKAAHSYIRTSIFPIGSRVEVEYTILIPRLLVDLPKNERYVAAWVAEEVQRMLSQTSDKKAFEVATNVASKLVDWYHHDLKRDWFKAELDKTPYNPKFKQPRKVKVARMWRAGVQWSKLAAMGTAVALAIGYTANSFRRSAP